MNRRLILLIIAVLSLCVSAGAQVLRDSVLINFRQSKIKVDTTYMNNTDALMHMREMIDFYHSLDTNYVLARVTIVGAASPEGSVKFNEYLSRQRADRITEHLAKTMQIPDDIVSFAFLGRDWRGLLNLVENDTDVPNRDEVIDLLKDIISNYEGGEREDAGNLERLKRLHYGVPYLYMYNNLFPLLRASRLRFEIVKNPIVPKDESQVGLIEVKLPSAPASLTPVETPPPAPEIPSREPFYMDIHTNMLYDAAAVPNIGVEFYLGKNLSISGDWMYGWWKTDRRHRYWRTYGGEIALRWWFGRAAAEKPLTGHHIGVYGGVLTYDFEWGGKGYMGGLPGGSLWDRCNYFGGIEYGYSLPITRRLNIDFTLGVGYLGGEYRTYVPVDNCYLWQSTRKRHWFGPTKAEISLVWLIGYGNVNKKKGGKR